MADHRDRSFDDRGPYHRSEGGGYRDETGGGYRRDDEYRRDDRNFRNGGTGYGGSFQGEDRDSRDRYEGGTRGPFTGPGGGRGRHDDDRGGDWYSNSHHAGERDSRSYGGGQHPSGAQERGFLDRAGDEVRSWFGDEEAERRRELDDRHDMRASGSQYGTGRHDEHYRNWRRTQIDALDRDYDEYRRENAARFEREFAAWRTERDGQRAALSRVSEHMEVVGSDGQHVGTVDKVRGDRIILTRSDVDAEGRHHSFPSRWIDSVDSRVTIRKTAQEAKAHWHDEDQGVASPASGFGGAHLDANVGRGGTRSDHS